MNNLRLILRSLRHRNYRLFFCGQAVSMIGTWIQQLAMSWLVFRLTGSALLLGVVGFADKIPAFFITPFAGIFLDRFNLRRVVLLTQTLLLLQALVLAGLTAAGLIQVWHIIVLSVCLGTINAFDIPARQSFVVRIIDEKSDLGNAIALNSSLFNGARLVGPSLGGILLAYTSEASCFFVNAASYLAAILALAAMRFTNSQDRRPEEPFLEAFKEGLSYTFGFPPVRAILLFLGLLSLFGIPITVLLPVFATKNLGGGPHTLGFLMGAIGAGALIGAIYLASRKSILGLGRLIVFSSGLFALGVISFSFSHTVWISVALLVVAGFGMMVHMASSNTILQTVVDDRMRGRVMSFYVVSITGTTPIGSLLAGAMASRIGAQATVISGGLVCLIGSAVFAFKLPMIRSLVRPIYEKMGIVPQAEAVQAGIRASSGLESLEG